VRALNVREPWASRTLLEGKEVGNHSWSTGWRGLLAIHAAARLDEGGLRPLARVAAAEDG
jgi:hypothetical protein